MSKYLQIGSNDEEQLVFSKKLLEIIKVNSSIYNKKSAPIPRIIIQDLKSFIILEDKDIFRFHFDKRKNLIKKILNYKSIDDSLKGMLVRKLRKLK